MDETDHGRLTSLQCDWDDACQMARKMIAEIEHAQLTSYPEPWELIKHIREMLSALVALDGGGE